MKGHARRLVLEACTALIVAGVDKEEIPKTIAGFAEKWLEKHSTC